jgi:hypothetical protein
MYRINRRPLAQPPLFPPPSDVLDHIEQVLLFGEPVETGRRFKRIWRLGNRRIDLQARTLSGQIGYTGSSQQEADRYDDVAREWVTELDTGANTARAPFVFHADTRYLAVLRAPTFSESAIPNVFNQLLARGEAARWNATDWDVEPLLDETDFLDWLGSVDSVQKVDFQAKLPNPSGRAEFDPVWERLDARRAKAIRETIEARDPSVGLVGINEDVTARAYIAMASSGYGWLRGQGRVEGRNQTYDQRAKVRKRSLPSVPQTWDEARERLTVLLQGLPE